MLLSDQHNTCSLADGSAYLPGKPGKEGNVMPPVLPKKLLLLLLLPLLVDGVPKPVLAGLLPKMLEPKMEGAVA